ncbi:unnamed protein product [Effrenium voratum]|nr:unnamed protein product [Effrenium voratum]
MAMRVLLLAPALAAGSCLEKGIIAKDATEPLPVLNFKTINECAKSCEWQPHCRFWSFKEDSGACYIFSKTELAKEADPQAFSGPQGCQDLAVLTDAADAATAAAAGLQESATGAAADMQTAVNGQVNAVTGAAADAQNAMTGAAADAQNAVTGAAADAQNAVNGQLNDLQEGANKAAATVTDGLNGLQEGAADTAANMADTMNGHLNNFANVFNGHWNSLQEFSISRGNFGP